MQSTATPGHNDIIIIMIFYCGLVVHITDTRAQNVVSYTSAHITETVFAHDQHWEEQSCLSSTQLYRHSQKLRKWINHTVGHHTTGASTRPALRGARHFPSTSYFLCVIWLGLMYASRWHCPKQPQAQCALTCQSICIANVVWTLWRCVPVSSQLSH